jgi:diguanylate cyclase (GGDEF)-like protein
LVPIRIREKPVLQCIVRDISELKQRELEAYQARKALERSNHELQVAMERLQLAATTDQLTAAWNRRFFNRVINTERARAARTGNPLSLILVDIDHFKQINDRHGHLVGDEVLVEIATTIQEALRVTDYLIRWGGEEFAILAPDLDEAEGEILAERLRDEVSQKIFSIGIRVTICAGVAQLHEDDILTKWVSRADNALYAAKENGRNRVVVGRVA